jgi:hypothetical protein
LDATVGPFDLLSVEVDSTSEAAGVWRIEPEMTPSQRPVTVLCPVHLASRTKAALRRPWINFWAIAMTNFFLRSGSSRRPTGAHQIAEKDDVAGGIDSDSSRVGSTLRHVRCGNSE